MPKKAPFVHKLIHNLNRLDTPSIQAHILDLLHEIDTYEDLLQNINQGVILTDAEGQIFFINRQASQWLGMERLTTERAKLLPQIKDEKLKTFLETHLARPEDKKAETVTLLHPREIKLQVTIIPIHRHGSKRVAILFTHTETNGKESPKPMEALVSLAAAIAHEIGNPLNSIAIHLQLLKKEIQDQAEPKRKRLEKALDVVQSETLRLDGIIRNFLKAVRRSPLRFKSEDLNQIAEEAIRIMKPELTSRGMQIHFKPDAALPDFLMDRGQIYQICVNLIKNAMEAMKTGGQLWIRISHKNNLALMQFRDQGAGIQETDLPHIFEAYYTTKKEGSGLGLLTVMHAVQDHGGRIEVTSKPGKGSTFLLMLPIRQPKLQLSHTKR